MKTSATVSQQAPVVPHASSQGVVPLRLDAEDLNPNEKRILRCFTVEGRRLPLTIPHLAYAAFHTLDLPPKQANSWVRNSLRRLVRAGLLEKVAKGAYRITVKGRSRLQALVAYH